MPGKSELRWFYAIMIAFIAGCMFMVSRENYWVAAFPLVVLIGYLAVFSIDTILLLIAFCTPLAIVLNDKSSGPALSIPGEPLMFGVMLLFIFKFVFEGKFDKRVLYHPISLAISFYLFWMFVTTLTSTDRVVSFKYLVSQLWFIVPFYFLGTQLFRNIGNIKKFVWLYSTTLFIVIAYTIFNHAANGWTQKAAHWVMSPFYNDHTAYAAALALFIPPMIAFMRNPLASVRERFGSGFMVVVLLTAIVLSYTRAAWLSLLVALACYFIYAFRIRFITVFVVGAGLLSAFLIFRTDIFIKLERNRQDSATDFNQHIQSISNISTDASNLERINRWNSAFRMWEIKPFWGWGPGTYQFNYAPFQKASEMTIISTNVGDMGNAHSEYIGRLAESGVFGAISMLLIVITIIYRGSILYSREKDPAIRRLTLGILLALVSYFTHGVLNNFLDTDKLSVPVWAFVAMLVALDVYHSNRQGVAQKSNSF